MNSVRAALIAAPMMLTAGALPAQQVLRPAPSTHAISEVMLSYPAPAPVAGAPAAPAATPAAKPLAIRLDYGQPHLRGRALHTDSLVPYDKVWRTGANAVTTFTTDVDLVLGGAALSKGSYVLFTIPGRTAWKLIIQKNVGQSAMYDQANDVARIDLLHTVLPVTVESFTMWLIPSTEPGPAKGELRFAWGTDYLTTVWSVK